ncbi:MAG TPA: class I SAM-dependent methyltransferase [Ignavibacteriales bacterium]|nr:class I SAM-dependent methyltransferase [Ignavibacteriales bacterium]
MIKTEFFETAVQLGFYGTEKGGLFGKKDNVRKYWEDYSIKSSLKPAILELLNRKEKLRVADFGCGCGEGYELITHISPVERPTSRDSLLTSEQIELYLGLDISQAMIAQADAIYENNKNMKFVLADLSRDYPFYSEEPFDIYLSTYSSPSHLTAWELENLIEKVLCHAANKAYLILDLFGRYSPEWPVYWKETSEEMQAYNMSWLYLPKVVKPEEAESYFVKYWDSKSLKSLINKTAKKLNKKISLKLQDRSVFVGRHMDTGFYNGFSQPLRYQVNRLFDRDYEGRVEKLKVDISYLDSYKSDFPEVWKVLSSYKNQWNIVIDLCTALIDKNAGLVKELIESTESELSEDLKMLAWLFRNKERFPVDNFWASIMGPQLACVLRNLEMNLPEGLGCGHSLSCIVEID